MLHVIYHTAYLTNDGAFLSCKELDACFNTIGDEHNYTLAEQPQIGCRLLLPKLELNKNISPKHREYLCSKHPDYNLKFACVCEIFCVPLQALWQKRILHRVLCATCPPGNWALPASRTLTSTLGSLLQELSDHIQ